MKYKKMGIAIVLIVIVILYACSHSTYYKYNDWWIIGKTADEIEARYGEFDEVYGEQASYFIEGFYFKFDPDGMDEYYYIVFDNKGIAKYVFVSVPYGG